MNKEAPHPQLPVVQRLRVRHARRGRLRFSSHRDFQRAFERAIRRAQVPIAFSSGFSPHPRISYAGAAPTGAASEAEYVEIALTAACDPERVCAALDAALPPGLDVLEVVQARAGDLAGRLQASEWLIELPGRSQEQIDTVVAAFLATDRVEVTRLTKQGVRHFDARAAVLILEPAIHVADKYRDGFGGATPLTADTCAILRLVVRHAVPAVRPDDVLTGLSLVGHVAAGAPPRLTRLAQGPLGDDGRIGDPLAPDRGDATVMS